MKHSYKQNLKRGKRNRNLVPASDDEFEYYKTIQKFSKRKSTKTPKRPAFDLE